eukprot:scaffold289_cov169-Ochromonas_danica.AAC.3
MTDHPLVSFVLPISPERFIQQLWLNSSFYESFLGDRLRNAHVTVHAWERIFSSNSPQLEALKRTAQSEHPMDEGYSYLRVLGVIPAFAQSIREQRVEFASPFAPCSWEVSDSDWGDLPRASEDCPHFIRERAVFKGLPFSDAFSIQTTWKVSPTTLGHTSLEVAAEVSFKRWCFAEGLIRFNTRKQLKEVLKQWVDYANIQIAQTPAALSPVRKSTTLWQHRLQSFFSS